MASESEVDFIKEMLDALKLDLKEDLASLKTDIHNILDKHDDSIYGNGMPGLTTRVRILEVGGAVITLVFSAWAYGYFSGG
jgi:hypothetical protein